METLLPHLRGETKLGETDFAAIIFEVIVP